METVKVCIAYRDQNGFRDENYKGAFGHRDFSIMAVNNSTFWCIIDVRYELMAVMWPLSWLPNAL
jgi:hypothetical protein